MMTGVQFNQLTKFAYNNTTYSISIPSTDESFYLYKQSDRYTECKSWTLNYSFDVYYIPNDELTVDTEGINTYAVYDVELDTTPLWFEYDNLIRFSMPKDKFKIWKLDCRENGLKDLVLDCKIRYVGGNLSEDEYTLDDILLTK